MNNESVEQRVMDAIRKGSIKMRPRWQFVLLSVLLVTGVAVVFLTLLYVTSLSLFLVRDSGTWFAPSFGARGWFDLLRTVPWVLVALILLFLFVLEVLVRRFAFVYKKPLLSSALAVLALVFFGGFLIAQTPLHYQLMRIARRGELPSPMGMMYTPPPRPSDAYHGRIIAVRANGFDLLDESGAGTTTVVITKETRLPYGSTFSVGERVMVIGDMGSSTVRAFGVREIDEYSKQ